MAIQKGLIHVTDNSGNVVDVHPETEISQVVGLSDALNNKANISDIPTKTSQLTNNSGFITKAVSDLTNYYTKSDLYTSTEVDNLISTIPKFKIEVVQSLPTTNISNSTIYLLKSSTTSGNLYTEYIYINSNWEELGTQEVNLSGYATTTWTTNQINNAKQELTDIIDSNNSDLTDIINGKADGNHTHGSDEITVLANYAKYSSNSPLTTDDTLNIALGKLERMMDDKQPRGNYLTNMDTAAKATADSNGNVISSTYATKDELSQKLDNNSSDFIKSIAVNGTTITYTKGDNTTGAIQTQDTTYPIATVNELSNGTDESGKLISAKNLKEFVSQEIVNNPNTGVQSITSGSENGSISVDGIDIFITGLGSSAFNDASDYATANHTHSSNNINLMTGYTPIAIDLTHIQPSDTLNQAINKLESTLENKSDSSNVPTKMSDLLNDTGYITDVSWDDVSNKPTSFNPVNHNQPSNTINEMTGYVKGNNTDPIEETDSLNDAIGKLEAILDTKASSDSVSNINSILNDKQDVLNIISPEELNDGLSASKRAISAQVISNYVTSKIDEVQNDIPTKVSELDNDTGYITEVSWNDIQDKPTEFTPSSHSHNIATTSTDGFMSSTDKIKLNSLEEQVQSDWDELDSTEKSFIKNKPFGYVSETRSNVDLIENVEYSKPSLSNGVYTYDVTSAIDFSGIKSDILYYCDENSPLELPLQFALTALDTNHNANVPSANIMLQLPLTVEYFSENGVSGYRGSTPMQNNRAEFEFETDATMNTVNYARILVSSSAGRLASYYAVYLDINEYDVSRLVKVPIKFIPDQPSSIITSMDGYTKAVNTSPISSNDTLNEAIGKLEKAFDDVQSSLPEMTAAEATNGTVTTARTISPKVLADYVTSKITKDCYYGTCDTTASTKAKTVTCVGFILVTGAEITVKFTVTNTASSPTLNVNSTGAKSIYYRGAAITAGYLEANRVYKFVYDGTYWQLIGDVDSNTDTKVNVTLGATTKAYLLGTSITPTATATETAAIADTNVYLTTTSGELHVSSLETSGNVVVGGTANTNYLQLPSGIKLY